MTETPHEWAANRLAHLRENLLHRFGDRNTEMTPDLLDAYLAPGMTWEEVAAKHHMTVRKMQGIIHDHLTNSGSYCWLLGRVGGGKDLMEKYRPAILAAEDYHESQAIYANVPHVTQPFYDIEGGAPLFSQPVRLDLSMADEGITMIGDDLVRVVGPYEVGKLTFSFYYHCYENTAKTVLNELRDRGILIPESFNQYSINPSLLPQE